ncbi:MAG: efflux transporter outer membrane subunit [Sphingomonadales bacterium]|nr:efflux transporter outer membrane subunit [Sphingomonadales bacterium]MDE2568510.1 efflux transporter outer membrane subunit [Sphingomonadales bacterium]
MNRSTLLRTLPAALMLASLAGCAAGPDYSGPPRAAALANARGSFLRAPDATTAEAPAARWWTALNDPMLDRLVEGALANSPGMAAANARIAQARAGLAANRTALLPTIETSFTAPYLNLPADLLNPRASGRTDTHAYNLGFDASWELSLFGGTQRKIESARDKAQAAEAGLADAQVSLSAEVARAYVALRARQAAEDLLGQQLEIDRKLAGLAAQRFAQGTVPRQMVDEAEARRAQSEGDLAGAKADVQVLKDQLAVLTGQEPGALDTALAQSEPVPLPPADVAVGDPARLIANRPDIRIAERQLAAANAEIGAQMAEGLPKISFMGLLGLGGSKLGDVLDPGTLLGIALPRLTWSLFDGGRNKAQVEAKKGAFAEAEANYRQAVLGALQDAENSLTRFGSGRIGFAKALEARQQASHAAGLQHQRAAAGTIGLGDALGADREALQARLGAVQARAGLTTGYIAVAKALGLGWTPKEPAS